MPDIHPSSVVHPDAQLADDVVVGPFCTIGKGVVLGAGCVLQSHVVLEGPAVFGERNTFFPFSMVGLRSQDLKYRGEPTFLEVGSDNVFRENCSINRSTLPEGKTIIGSHNHFLVNSHAGHDCVIGNHVIFSGYAAAAGHVTVEDYAILSAFAAIHQFARVGKHCIISAASRVSQDAPPFCIIDGHPAHTRGVNTVGLSRRGFTEQDIRNIKSAYRKLFLKKTTVEEAIKLIEGDSELSNDPNVRYLVDFVKSSERGIS